MGVCDVRSLGICDAGRCPALDDDPVHERTGQHLEIGPAQRGFEIRARHTGTAAAARRRAINPAKALLALAVDIIRKAVAGLERRLHEGGGERCGAQIGRLDRERSRYAVIGVGAVGVLFRAFEIRQNVGIAPSAKARHSPAIVVAGVPTNVHHAVDRGRTAQDATARMREPAAIQEGFRIGDIVPVEAIGAQQAADRGRHGDAPASIPWPGFDEQHADRRVFREAGGQHAAGRACADDHVIMTAAGGESVLDRGCHRAPAQDARAS